MTREPRWIDKRALLRLHEESLILFGGPTGLRDEGLLDSALARPRNVYAYNPDCTIAALAAAYGFGLAKNHAFLDGNKRAAFLAIGLFLAINSARLVASQEEAIQTMLGVAASEIGESGLERWIGENTVPKSHRATGPEDASNKPE